MLITGGSGLIGRQVADILCAAGAAVKIISLDRVRVNDKAEQVFGDLTSFDFCNDAVKGMDYVFHLAGVKGSALVSQNKLASHFVPTLMLNTNVLEACRVNQVAKAVFSSSIGAYADAEVLREADDKPYAPPMDFAGWAKRMGELQIYAYKAQYGLENFAIVRLSNVYGPGDNFDPQSAMVIPSLIYRIYHKEDPVVVWGDGTAIRDFVYSRDAAEGLILALYYGTQGRFLNLGGGREYSIAGLLETLHSFLEFNYKLDASKAKGFSRRVMEITLAKELIGYNPMTSLKDGLQQTWNWFVAHADEYLQKKNYFQQV